MEGVEAEGDIDLASSGGFLCAEEKDVGLLAESGFDGSPAEEEHRDENDQAGDLNGHGAHDPCRGWPVLAAKAN